MKTSYDWMTWSRQQSEGINYKEMANSGRRLTSAYELEALKKSS